MNEFENSLQIRSASLLNGACDSNSTHSLIEFEVNMEKKCKKCGKTKPLTDFYKKKGCLLGRDGSCKVCRRKQNSEYQKKYRKTENGIARRRKNRMVRNKKKSGRSIKLKNIYSTVYRALKKGMLTKPSGCQMCGSKEYIQGHHEDYSKPLEVMWLCSMCHLDLHKYRDKAKELLV